MNDTAENIGCENTHFANPNGLKVKNHYSTAYDIMQIARVAFSNSVVAKVAGTREYTVPATNKSGKRVLKSHVSFIENQSTGIYAGKTGYWDDGNASIALGYEKDGLRMNPYGEVVSENTNGIVTVNGHSYADPALHTENTNFALLVSNKFTEPFEDSNEYGESIARLSNMIETLALAPMRSAPASIISITAARSHMPPEAFT